MVTLAMLAGLAMPPPEYDYTPNPRPEVIEFGPDLISQACGVPFRVAGCFIRGKVFLLSTLTPDARALVLRHEHGHANGWRH